MRTRQTVATSVLLLVLLGVAGAVQSLAPQSLVATSPEVGFTSFSPRGASGGAIVPASCESISHWTGLCSGFSFTADSYTVAYNTGTTLRWSLSGNAGAYVWYCEAGGGPWSGVKAIPSGAEGTAALTSATTYTLLCHFYGDNDYGSVFNESKSVTINVNSPNSCYPSANPAGYGSACTSAANACGQTNSGTIGCSGACSASTPANPAGYGSACSSAANACGQTQANGTIQCNGSCSSTPPALPAGYGSSCTSAPNACGQTRSNGTIQCNGSCSSTPPPGSNCSPDLSAGATTASPSSGTPGQSESFSATVSNTGAGPASNFPNIFQIANSAITATVAMLNAGTVASLSSGASAGISSSYTFSSAGSYNVRACANYNTSWGGSVTETNSNNNCGAWLPLSITYPALSVSCSGAPGNPYVGQTVTWSSSVSGGSGTRTYSWSGTESLSGTSASVQKTYTTIGQKSATLTVSDTLSGQVVPATCSTGANQPNGPANGGAGGSGVGVGSCVASLSVSPSTVEQGENTTLTWSVAGGSLCASSCSGSGFATGGATSGSAAASVLPAPPTTAYALTCSGGTYGPPPPANASVTVLVPTATLTANGQSSTARVNPSTPNNTVVAWSSSNSASCAVTKNGAAWRTGLSSAGVTETVTTQTVYAIDCVNNHGTHATGSVTVNLLTGFEEF